MLPLELPKLTRDVAARVALLAAAACTADRSPREAATVAPSSDSAAAVPDAALDSTVVRSAQVALGAFLEASREGAVTRASLAALTACPAGDDVAAGGPMLAAFEVLPPVGRRDAVVGRAVATTVADQDVDRRHPGYYVARLRVRSDTLEWDLLPSDSGSWLVCNGMHFGLSAPDSLTTWRPDGASRAAARATALAIADSVAARGAANAR